MNDEKIRIFGKPDLIVTNPPFSKIDTFILELLRDEKKFILLGRSQILFRKDMFSLFFKGFLKLGFLRAVNVSFVVPSSYAHEIINGRRIAIVNNISFFHNLDFSVPCSFKSRVKFNPLIHEKIDNYNAILCRNLDEIPSDYSGEMAVPFSFLNYWSENEFELLGMLNSFKENKPENGFLCGNEATIFQNGKLYKTKCPVYRGKPIFSKIIIRKLPQNNGK